MTAIFVCAIYMCIVIRLHRISVPEPALANPAKSGSGQIISWIYRIWRMPVQLQYVQLITDKTNAAGVSGGLFAILISVTRILKIQNPLPFLNFCQKLAET